ncbi:MAG: sugar ABC transporter permease [Pseudolysinimonas sp.]
MTTFIAVLKRRSPSNERPGPDLNGLRFHYPQWFLTPAIVLFVVFFAIPTFASLFFAFTRWTLSDFQFIGVDNFVNFFRDPQLSQGFLHTLVYGVVTSLSKVVLGFFLAVFLTSPVLGRGYLRSVVFFPVLVSTVGVGLTFKTLLDPFHGIVNGALSAFGIQGPGWLADPRMALMTVAAVDIWKGVGLATLIFIAGIVAIPQEYFEAARVDGAGVWGIIRRITIPLSYPAITTVVILSLIGGLRSFDLIWTMTSGGPGFTSDVIGSVIYKEYQAGFYGLSTAGNVILIVVVAAIMVPLTRYLRGREVDQ